MIRPVFEQVPAVPLTVSDQNPFRIFPNPTSGKVSISGSYQKLKVWSMSGELLIEELRSSEHDFSFLKRGVYLVETIKNGTSNIQRLSIH